MKAVAILFLITVTLATLVEMREAWIRRRRRARAHREFLRQLKLMDKDDRR